MVAKIKLIVVDDHELLRKGCISLLKKDPGISITGEAENGKEALDLLKNSLCDIVLLDLEMPIMNGDETLDRIKKLYPSLKVIIISAHYNETLVTEYISRGANAYLYKNIKIEKLLDAIYSVYEKGQYFDYYTANAMLKNLKKEKSIEHYNPLSGRETEVLSLVCKDYTNNEIGIRLHLSPRTIAFHRSNISKKTGCKRKAQMVMYALRNGIINTETRNFTSNDPPCR